MKPFVLFSIREDDDAATAEYASVRKVAGLRPEELLHVRAEQEPLPPIDLEHYSGFIIGGGPFNASDDVKSLAQVRVEAELGALLDAAIAVQFPVLGICYGVGILTSHLGGVVDSTYREDLGAIKVTVSDAGRADPLFAGVAEEFEAFTAHKEACTVLPPDAVVLATGTACPVQAFRVGSHLYATQFHVELDAPALIARMSIYRNHGYFRPEEFDDLSAAALASNVTDVPGRILRNFVREMSAQA